MCVGFQSKVLQTVGIDGCVRAVVGCCFNNAVPTFRVVVDDALSDLRKMVHTVQEVRGPEDKTRSLADIVTLGAESGERTAFEERGRADDRLLSRVLATIVASPSLSIILVKKASRRPENTINLLVAAQTPSGSSQRKIDLALLPLTTMSKAPRTSVVGADVPKYFV